MSLISYLPPDSVLARLEAKTKEPALVALASRVVELHPELDQGEVFSVLCEREAMGSTGIGDGVAIPHGKLAACREITVLVARSVSGCDFGAVDGRACHIFCLLLAPPEAASTQFSVLEHFVRLFKVKEFRDRFMEAADAESIWKLLDSAWRD